LETGRLTTDAVRVLDAVDEDVRDTVRVSDAVAVAVPVEADVAEDDEDARTNVRLMLRTAWLLPSAYETNREQKWYAQTAHKLRTPLPIPPLFPFFPRLLTRRAKVPVLSTEMLCGV